MIHYNNSNVNHAKQLRKNMTPWERKLWYLFLKDYPIRFQRQKSIDNCILEQYGLKVIRFCNTDIDQNFYSVCTVIDNEVKQRI